MDLTELKDQANTIRTAFSYINRFKNHTFVIKIDSTLLGHSLFPLLIKDIVLLHNMGIRIVLIPGARNRINEILATYKIKCRTVNNIRITPEEAMPFIKMAAFDVSNMIMTLLAENNTNAIIGNWVKARSLGVINGVDFKSSGSVEKLKIEIIQNMLNQGLIPIFPNIGWSATGKPYNISSNELSFTVSRDLKAAKLFFISDTGGISARGFKIPENVYVSTDNIISQLTALQAMTFLKLNQNNQNITALELIKLAHQACLNGIDRVHIIDGSIEGMLLKEIFSARGLGTMIYNDPHENIRQAVYTDIPEILRIMQPAIEEQILKPRKAEDISLHINDYVLYEVDGIIHACGALHKYSGKQGEIAGIAVDKTYSNLGIGKKLISYFIEKATKLSLNQVFVLTTQTADWFLQNGFVKADISQLPKEKQKNYSKTRNSLILIYNLGRAVKKERFSVE